MAEPLTHDDVGEGDLGEDDLRYLERCLDLAERGGFGVAPNPMVGCVVVKDDVVLGEGWHARVGGPHAEVEALRAARDAGHDVANTTVYVSLEPCAHHGRTPPCAEALVDAGVSRVVALHGDPNPSVAGGGFGRLRAAGIEVAFLAAAAGPSGRGRELVDRGLRLNWRFLVQQVLGRPAVTLKWAMSLDGRIATHTGESQWISSPEGREWALGLREEHDAILVGSGTALADDPRLNRRLGRAEGAILRVVLDRRLRLPPTARMLAVDGPVLVYGRRPAEDDRSLDAWRDRADALRRAGAEVVEAKKEEDATPGSVVEDLGRRGVQSLLVEGGAAVAGAFAAAGVFDRVAVCCAPLLIGGLRSPGPLAGEGFAALADAPRLASFSTDLSIERHGDDVVLTTFRKRCLQDLSTSVAG